MHSKTFFWLVGAWVLVLALGTSAAAQGRSREQFRGIINDFTPAHNAQGSPNGPWEMHGAWRLDLNWGGSTADFSAALTMENSDYWLLINSNPPADPDSPATRTPHTHHITMTGAQVTTDPSAVASGCPTASYKPPTTTGFMVPSSFGFFLAGPENSVPITDPSEPIHSQRDVALLNRLILATR
jgi:hypothetical protein